MTQPSLEEEAARLGELLRGKTVRRVRRHRRTALLIEFEDGTRLFVDRSDKGLEFSVTGGAGEALKPD
jgi:hypothetical protein